MPLNEDAQSKMSELMLKHFGPMKGRKLMPVDDILEMIRKMNGTIAMVIKHCQHTNRINSNLINRIDELEKKVKHLDIHTRHVRRA